jgi:transcriptional regulator GlxA family with amidase domain
MQKTIVHQHRVAVLALEDSVATTITGPQDVLSMTGVLYEISRGAEPTPYFSVRIVTPDGRPVRCYNNLSVTPHCAMDEWQADVVIVPGILNIDETLERSRDVINWLQEQFAGGTVLTAVCSGSILLAATGLLDGRKAATHWAMANMFRKLYPGVNLIADALITEQDNLVCSGGYNSFLDVSLHLVEKFCGPAVALQCSKIFVHDIGRRSQAPYSIFNGPRDHGNERILQIQEKLEKEYRKSFDFTELARRYGMGRRTLERHFKKATGETPLAYLQRIRVERAKQLLESGNASLDEISYQVGYMDTGFFRKLFVKYTSLRPSEYRARCTCTARQQVQAGSA